MTSASTLESTEPPQCKLELGLGLGHGFGIPCVTTVIVLLIFIYTGYKHAYILGLVLGVVVGVTFIVACIIIASLISTDAISGIPMASPFVFGATGIATAATIIGIIVGLVVTGVLGNKCKLELGLGLGLVLGIQCLIICVIAVIFIFSSFLLFKGVPDREEIGNGIITGLLSAIGIGIYKYFKYDKPKQKQRCTKHKDDPPKSDDDKPNPKKGQNPGDIPLDQTDTKGKTKNPGSSSAVSREHVSVQMEKKGFKIDEEERPTAVHTRTQNKFDPNTNSKQTNDRQQPVPPVNTGFEDTPTFRQLPQPPQNIKDRNQRGISATIDDTSDLASETPRPIKLPPLTPKQTVQNEDASEEPKKKKKKKKKKDQMNVETPEEENAETDLMVN